MAMADNLPNLNLGTATTAIGTALLVALILLSPSISCTEGIIFGLNRPHSRVVLAAVFLLYLFGSTWSSLVDRNVPEPYLDEVFHIPQAQRYCVRNYDWDDKITTPPGLYALSVLANIFGLAKCSTTGLRRLNLLGVWVLPLLAALCRRAIEASASTRAGQMQRARTSLYTFHTAINVALFPPLFFFTALYYTDVASTGAVLLCYLLHLIKATNEGTSIARGALTSLVAAYALFLRQTNVFWAVVYVGGLEAVRAVQSLEPIPVRKDKFFATSNDLANLYLWRYSLGEVHDPHLSDARFHDWVLCAVSYGVAVLSNPLVVLSRVWPQVTVLGLFVGFVAWNSGVVLGKWDKSNHVATLHLSQMNYLWPFIAFFSAPLMLAPATTLAMRALVAIKSLTTWSPNRNRNHQAKQSAASATNAFLTGIHLLFGAASIVLSLALVKYNTIIHSFSLADNRHYMFYVFRYTILRPGSVRYYLVAAYAVSRWLVWNRLAGEAKVSPALGSGHEDKKLQSRGEKTVMLVNPGHLPTLDDPNSTAASSPKTSTALLWVLATTLSLATAPLVEPRYFILPWVFWRLHVPAWPIPSSTGADHELGLKSLARRTGQHWLLIQCRRMDVALVLETIWFLVLNVGTMYAFLYRPYYWRDAEGNLLEEGMQRFMW